jgi:hypothetical protein
MFPVKSLGVALYANAVAAEKANARLSAQETAFLKNPFIIFPQF